VTWSSVAAGSYSLTARAADDDGAVTTSAARTISVSAPVVRGLLGEYFAMRELSGSSVLVRVDPVIDFDWAGQAPDPKVPADDFSVRWTGFLKPGVSGTYTLFVRANDGIRLWLDNKTLIDKWFNQSATDYSAQVTLTAGQRYQIRIEYFEGASNASQQLSWSGPSIARQVIPSTFLEPAAAPSGPAYVRLVNRDTGDWMHDGGARADYGRRTDDLALWRIIDASGPSWRWIVNKATGEMLHIEAQADWVQCDVKPDGRWSSMWSLPVVSKDWHTIGNRWKTVNACHVGNKKGYVQHKSPSLSSTRTHWSIVVPVSAPVPTAIAQAPHVLSPMLDTQVFEDARQAIDAISPIIRLGSQPE
jgi:PA14 domain